MLRKICDTAIVTYACGGICTYILLLSNGIGISEPDMSTNFKVHVFIVWPVVTFWPFSLYCAILDKFKNKN